MRTIKPFQKIQFISQNKNEQIIMSRSFVVANSKLTTKISYESYHRPLL